MFLLLMESCIIELFSFSPYILYMCIWWYSCLFQSWQLTSIGICILVYNRIPANLIVIYVGMLCCYVQWLDEKLALSVAQQCIQISLQLFLLVMKKKMMSGLFCNSPCIPYLSMMGLPILILAVHMHLSVHLVVHVAAFLNSSSWYLFVDWRSKH